MPKEKRLVTIYAGNGRPITVTKQSRNTPCKCGSGKKAKNCCGTEAQYYNTRPTPKPA